MKKSFLLIFCLLFGCGKKAHIIEYAGRDFSHTSSMCLDALLVNMDTEMCISPLMTAMSNPGIMVVECEGKIVEGENFWTDNLFFLVPSSSHIVPDPSIMICSDFNFTLYVATPEAAQENSGE